jgi:hypothetical protein
LVKLGNFELRPRVSYGLDYAEGVLVSPGQPKSTFTESLSSGVSLRLGPNWSAEYSGNWSFFSNRDLKDSAEHSASVSGAHKFGPVPLSFSQSLALTNSPSLETGRQTEIITSATSLGAAYPIGRKLGLAGSIAQSIQFAQSAPDAVSWSGNGSGTYTLRRGLVFSFGISGGYSIAYRSPESVFIGPRVAVTWETTRKISLSASGSLDQRWVLGGASSFNQTPTYTVSATYGPFSQTNLSLGASLTDSPSLLRGQTRQTEAWSLGINQRLLGALQLSLGYNQSTSTFTSIVARGRRVRRDDRDAMTAGLSMGFIRRGSVSVTYEQGDNSSNEPGFGTRSQRVGLSVGYGY